MNSADPNLFYLDRYADVYEYYDDIISNLTAIRDYLAGDYLLWIRYQSGLMLMIFFAMMMVAIVFMHKIGRR